MNFTLYIDESGAFDPSKEEPWVAGGILTTLSDRAIKSELSQGLKVVAERAAENYRPWANRVSRAPSLSKLCLDQGCRVDRVRELLDFVKEPGWQSLHRHMFHIALPEVLQAERPHFRKVAEKIDREVTDLLFLCEDTQLVAVKYCYSPANKAAFANSNLNYLFTVLELISKLPMCVPKDVSISSLHLVIAHRVSETLDRFWSNETNSALLTEIAKIDADLADRVRSVINEVSDRGNNRELIQGEKTIRALVDLYATGGFTDPDVTRLPLTLKIVNSRTHPGLTASDFVCGFVREQALRNTTAESDLHNDDEVIKNITVFAVSGEFPQRQALAAERSGDVTEAIAYWLSQPRDEPHRIKKLLRQMVASPKEDNADQLGDLLLNRLMSPGKFLSSERATLDALLKLQSSLMSIKKDALSLFEIKCCDTLLLRTRCVAMVIANHLGDTSAAAELAQVIEDGTMLRLDQLSKVDDWLLYQVARSETLLNDLLFPQAEEAARQGFARIRSIRDAYTGFTALLGVSTSSGSMLMASHYVRAWSQMLRCMAVNARNSDQLSKVVGDCEVLLQGELSGELTGPLSSDDVSRITGTLTLSRLRLSLYNADGRRTVEDALKGAILHYRDATKASQATKFDLYWAVRALCDFQLVVGIKKRTELDRSELFHSVLKDLKSMIARAGKESIDHPMELLMRDQAVLDQNRLALLDRAGRHCATNSDRSAIYLFLAGLNHLHRHYLEQRELKIDNVLNDLGQAACPTMLDKCKQLWEQVPQHPDQATQLLYYRVSSPY